MSSEYLGIESNARQMRKILVEITLICNAMTSKINANLIVNKFCSLLFSSCILNITCFLCVESNRPMI